MDKITGNFTGSNSFPLDCETLEALQQNIAIVSMLGNMGGDKKILVGCELNADGSERGEGYVFLKSEACPTGEVLRWIGGAIAGGMHIETENVDVSAYGNVYKNAYTRRRLAPGTGEETYYWDEFSHPAIANTCKGYFFSYAALRLAYPNPEQGWWALVGDTLPAEIYRVNDAEIGWEATGVMSGELNVDLHEYLTKQTAEAEYVRKDVVDKIVAESMSGTFSELETKRYMWAVIDNEGKTLLGIDVEGNVEFGADIPKQIKQRLRMAINPIKRELAELTKRVVLNTAEITDLRRVVTNGSDNHYVWALVDSEGRGLIAVTNNGDVEFGAGVPESIRRHVASRLSPIKEAVNTLSTIVEELKTDITEITETINSEDVPGSVFTIFDRDKKPLFHIDSNGVAHPVALALPDTTKQSIKQMMTQSGVDLSAQARIELPMPTALCRVDLLCPFPLNDSYFRKNKLRCRARFTGMGYSFEKEIELEWQGSSSLNFPLKNLAITWLNDDGEDCDVRFGTMIATSDYHLKANFIDATHSRNVCSCRLYEQMQQTRSYPKRPWQETVAMDASDTRLLFDNGAMGHIDGFPVEVYHNGEYWGLFTMNLKKDRKNFRMDKKSQKEIILELGGGRNSNNTWDNFSWADYEIRNPKVKNASGGDYVEGDTPEACEMKQNVEEWFAWLKTVSDEDFKAEAQERMFIPQMIDYMLLMTIINNGDCWTRNGLFCSWDGYKFGLMPYDLDGVFGLNGYGLKSDNATAVWLMSNWENGTTTSGCDLVYGRIYRQFKDEFLARYAELRHKGIFTVDNITGLFEEFGRQVGADAYERHFNAWVYEDGTCMIPSHRPEGSVIPEEYKNNFCVDGGWFTSVAQINEWLKVRFNALDKVFGYNQ